MEDSAYAKVVYEKKSGVGKAILIFLAILAFVITIVMLIYVMARIDEVDRVSLGLK